MGVTMDEVAVVTARYCPRCGGEMEPVFDSPCEAPVAWICQPCASIQMDVDRALLSPDTRHALEEMEAFLRTGGAGRAPQGARARARARALATRTRDIPVDVQRLAEECGYPVRERSLPPGERGTIARDGDRTVIVINRDRPWQSDAERRWIIAEELGHALLEHSALVASSAPHSAPPVPEPRRRVEEREAKAFAAELLMPEDKVRARFRELAPRIDRALGLRQREAEVDEVVRTLARMFAVTPTAMRLRLEELGLVG